MSHPTQFMAIINLTPDSFSGDGLAHAEAAVAAVDAAVAQGAAIIDLGAESTRPGAKPLAAAEEWARLGPVLAALAAHPARGDFRLSVDSYHPETMAKALAAGADIANDVSGLRSDAMVQLLAQHRCPIVVMHALTLPADPEITWEAGVDAVAEILGWKQAINRRAVQADIDPARLIFDPGLGFGKTAEQSLQLLLRVRELLDTGGNWLIGHSRKSFLGLFTEAKSSGRDDVTLALSAMLIQAGVPMLRVHNIARHRALRERLCM